MTTATLAPTLRVYAFRSLVAKSFGFTAFACDVRSIEEAASRYPGCFLKVYSPAGLVWETFR